MDTVTNFSGLRDVGIALLAVVVVFMIGAFFAAYFRQASLPSDPLQQLTLIANDRIGWTAQAIIFPLAFLATAILFGVMAARMPDAAPRWLAMISAFLVVVGFVLWLPISMHRLELGANAAEMIRTFDLNAPVEVGRNTWSFWPHTLSILAAIALMGAALALAGAAPTLGWVVAGLAVAGALLGVLVMHDWPPFMSYVIVLVMAIGLIRSG
ncbi:MAG: hypothetical protein BroJett021_10060 [Chloroflexota bacterium]|nr:MAG: hypothetical protein BroJett021_10060 [Chloroflexota bacterium]